MNLMMIAVMVIGWFCTKNMHREEFPEFDLDNILVSVPYPGATPAEVEEGICQKIEEAVRSVDGIKKVTSIASEGNGSVVLELYSNVNADRVLDEVRAEIGRIPSFPQEAEDEDVRRVVARRPAIRVGVVGPEVRTTESELALREVAEKVRADLLLLKSVSQVDFLGGRDFQIDVEIPEKTLRAHDLSLPEVADIVRQENMQLPGGTMRTNSQEFLLRGDNRRLIGSEIGELPLISQENGAVLRIEDVGVVRDEFADSVAIAEIEGQPAMALSVQRSAEEDLLAMIDDVKAYVADVELPYGYRLMTWADRSTEVRSRLNLLIDNGTIGLILVFSLLALFLDLKLAFWVGLGIPFTLLATGGYLFFTGETMNMLSMFGFVMALGIVVDDAIVVGENIYAHRRMGKPHVQAAIDGAVEVVPSVGAAVVTTIFAFLPLLFVSGLMGKFMAVMPVAIIGMLVASLIESFTVLPCHLAHAESYLFRAMNVVFFAVKWILIPVRFLNRGAAGLLDRFVTNVYIPTLKVVLQNRSIFVTGCIGLLILAVGVVRSGAIKREFFPSLEGNTIQAQISFPDGTPGNVTDRWTKHMEQTFWQTVERLAPEGEDIANTSFRLVGSQLAGGGPGPDGQKAGSGSHLGSVEVELVNVEQRSVSTAQILTEWRKAAGEIPGAEKLTFKPLNIGPSPTPVEFKLLAAKENAADLEVVVERCKKRLAEYPGAKDISDDAVPGKWEFRLRVKPEAMALGVRTQNIAETIRAAYYGQEVMRLQRGRHEVRLMVRYPQDERRSMSNFREIRVRTRQGQGPDAEFIERPLMEVADVTVIRGYSEINRVDQLRSITVSSDLDRTVGNADRITRDLQDNYLPELLKEFPSVSVRWEGQEEQRKESLGSLARGFGVAILAMFILLSFEFKSYVQPWLVLAIVPFGIIGAIAGHALMGKPLSLFSFFGFVALTGIVVNDSIVLIDFINARVRAGMPLNEALIESGRRRFRPVFLTTITTVFGLLPILLEKSLQAQIIIPMATSIAFGEIFATVLVLYLVPVGYSLYWMLLGHRTMDDHLEAES